MVKALRLTPVQNELLGCLRNYECAMVNTGKLEDRVEPKASAKGDPDAFVWVQATIDSMIDRELVEALELLALLAYVDWPLWKMYMHELWPRRPFLWENAYDTRPAKVGVDLSRSEYDLREEVYALVASASPDTDRTPRYKRAKTVLLRELARQGKTVDEIPVRVAFQGGARASETGKILQVLERQRGLPPHSFDGRAPTQDTISSYVGLRVRQVRLNASTVLTASDKDISRLIHAIDALASGALTNKGILPATNTTDLCRLDLMNELFPAGDSVCMAQLSSVAHMQLETLADLEAFPAVAAALSTGINVQTVDFIPGFRLLPKKRLFTDEQRRQQHQAWSWFAYGLFVNPPASPGHRVQHLRIDTKLMNQLAIDAVKSVLEAPNPVAVLFGQCGSDQAGETVSAARLALSDPTGNSAHNHQPRWSPGHALLNLPVIDRTDELVSVLLPRWGRAWVHCDDIARGRPFKPASLHFRIQSVPHVTFLNVEVSSINTIVPLLKLTGKAVRRVTIEPAGPHETYISTLCTRILEACPAVEELEVRSKTAAQRSKCENEIKHLGGRQIVGRFDSRAKFAFLSALAPRQASENELQVIQKLDAIDASTILKFAAPTVVRHVVCVQR